MFIAHYGSTPSGEDKIAASAKLQAFLIYPEAKLQRRPLKISKEFLTNSDDSFKTS